MIPGFYYDDNILVHGNSIPPTLIGANLQLSYDPVSDIDLIIYLLICQSEIYDTRMYYDNFDVLRHMRTPVLVKIGRSSSLRDRLTVATGDNKNAFAGRINDLQTGGPFKIEPLFMWAFENPLNLDISVVGVGDIETGIRNLATTVYGATSLRNEWVAFRSFLELNKFISHISLRLLYRGNPVDLKYTNITTRREDPNAIGHYINVQWPMLTISNIDISTFIFGHGLPSSLVTLGQNINTFIAINQHYGLTPMYDIHGRVQINALVDIIIKDYEQTSGISETFPITVKTLTFILTEVFRNNLPPHFNALI